MGFTGGDTLHGHVFLMTEGGHSLANLKGNKIKHNDINNFITFLLEFDMIHVSALAVKDKAYVKPYTKICINSMR